MRSTAQVLCVLFVSLTTSGFAADDPAGKPLSEQDVETRLRNAKLKLDFQKVPFEQVLKHLSREAGVEVFIDLKTLEDEGLALDKPVSISLQTPISAWDALELSLRLEGRLGVYLRHGAVVVTTATQVGNELETRLYDCRDLAPPAPMAAGPTPDCQGFAPTPAPIAKSSELDDLIDVLTTVVEPDSWDEVGGAGSIREFRGVLLIRQSQPVHREIAHLLADLRAAHAEKPHAQDSKDAEHSLNRLLPGVKWEGVPAREVLRSLSKQLALNLVIDERTLTDEGVDLDALVTLVVNGPIRAGDALRLVLGPLQLGHCRRFGVQFVTTATSLGNLPETRIYDCRKLTKATDGDDLTSLREVLSSTIDPDTWGERAGDDVSEFRGMLVIRHVEAVHAQIAEALARLDQVLESTLPEE